MGKYKIMEYGQPDPKWTTDEFVPAGKTGEDYTLAVGRLRVSISKQEKEEIINVWDKIDKGELKGG